MNAARALLLPRGNPRRRMPLWLQRLKALDLLAGGAGVPVVPDSRRDVSRRAAGRVRHDGARARARRSRRPGSIALRSVETTLPSPFAASLQFGFVMDWLYADDAPRAEQRAALLSLDRALLDELMGGEGADDSTLDMLESMLARRRGTAPGTRARTADELAALIDRAGDLTLDEARERVATSTKAGAAIRSPSCSRAAAPSAIDVPVHGGATERRIILTETFPRYVAAFGADAFTTVYAGSALEPRAVADVDPRERCGDPRSRPRSRDASCSRASSRSPARLGRRHPRALRTSIATWVERAARRMDARRASSCAERSAAMRRRRAGRRDACSSRRADASSRRRASRSKRSTSRASRTSCSAGSISIPSTRLAGDDGTATVVRQMYGLARPAERWERDYFAGARRRRTTPTSSRDSSPPASSCGSAAASTARRRAAATSRRCASCAAARRARGSPRADAPPLGEQAQSACSTRSQRDGASFFDELHDVDAS